MGKKSSSTPAPDPRLVEAQIKSMGFQDEAIRKMMEHSDELAPIQREQMQFGLDSARTAYDQSQEDRQYALGMRDKYTAALNPLLERAGNFDEGQRRAEMFGEATGDITQAYGMARGQQQRELDRRGVNPSDGMGQAFSRQMASDEALAKVLAGRKVSEAARMEGLTYEDRAVNALAGFPSQASGLSVNGAGFGASGLSLANGGLSGLNSGWGTVGTAAGGLGSNATGMWGQQANYKLGQDRLAADNDPAKTILGAAAGAGMAAMTGGASLAVSAAIRGNGGNGGNGGKGGKD